jgi:hypothetical protein
VPDSNTAEGSEGTMNIGGIEPADVVEVDRRGRVFHATVHARGPGCLQLEPLRPNITWRQARSHQVIRHWRQRKLVRGRVSTGPIRTNDIVAITIDGVEVLALVRAKERSKLRVRPLDRTATLLTVCTHAARRHYRLCGRPRAARAHP